MSELKPCPFCGVHIGVANPDWWSVHPGNGCILENTEYEKDELDKWNRRASGWIPVNEKRPDSDDPVLVIDVIGDIMIGSRSAFHSIRVTHWQPLPEPPK